MKNKNMIISKWVEVDWVSFGKTLNYLKCDTYQEFQKQFVTYIITEKLSYFGNLRRDKLTMRW